MMQVIERAVYRQGSHWLVQGLEFDILAYGDTRDEALQRFLLTWELENDIRIKGGFPPIPPTPKAVADRARALEAAETERRSKQRYDIHYHEHHVAIEPHFCRSWDDEGGCYGTNPNHGFSWQEARKADADWHRERAEWWATRHEDDEFPPPVQQGEDK
jgi:hypothetical protein